MNGNRHDLASARRQRLTRAQWWFGKMRQIVNLALPPRPMAAPRPEQTCFNLPQLPRR